MKVEHTIPESLEDLEVVMEGFIGEMNRLLLVAGLSLPAEDIPEIEFSEMEVRCYDPAKGIHDFEPHRHFGYYEALGAYHPSDADPGNRQISLFIRNLERVAVVYTLYHRGIKETAPDFKKYLDINFRRILSLVICHELAHWLVHRCMSHNGSTLGNLYYEKNDEIFYHEGLAQALVYAALTGAEMSFDDEAEDAPSLKDIMLWMEGGQPEQYIAYKRLGTDGIKILKAMDLFRHSSIQSFELLEQAVHLFNNDQSPDLEKLFERFFKKPFTPYFQSECLEEVTDYMYVYHPECSDRLRGVIAARRFGI